MFWPGLEDGGSGSCTWTTHFLRTIESVKAAGWLCSSKVPHLDYSGKLFFLNGGIVQGKLEELRNVRFMEATHWHRILLLPTLGPSVWSILIQ
jgi:hypothetical protein